ncbi:WAT1-related protein isoform X1 [Tanacetum coccineum]
MRRKLFTHIVPELTHTYSYFQQTINAVGRCGISVLVMCTFAILQLAYNAIPDSLDEYLQIGNKIARDCLVGFCNGIMELYGDDYLRKSTQTDVEKLYTFHEEKHEFSGMIGSIDYTKWPWAQCPTGLCCQFWSNNDINMLCQSPLLNDLKETKGPEVPFVANDVNNKWGYYLTNGIYPE